MCVKGIPRRFNEDLMDKFRKSRLETEDFANSFNFYRARVKQNQLKTPEDEILQTAFHFKTLQRGNFLHASDNINKNDTFMQKDSPLTFKIINHQLKVIILTLLFTMYSGCLH